MPYFIDTDGSSMTEALAIHKYIAEKWNKNLLGTSVEERADIEMIAFLLKDIKTSCTLPCYESTGS